MIQVNPAPRWLVAARRLHALKISAGVACSCRMVTDHAEASRKLAAVERCYGVRLPPTYREFLLQYDGWPTVFRDASLSSCAQLLSPVVRHRAEIALDRAHVPFPTRTGSRGRWRQDDVIPIGVSDSANMLIALDANSVDACGEMDTLMWVADIGVRLPSFTDMLLFLTELVSGEMMRRLHGAFAA